MNIKELEKQKIHLIELFKSNQGEGPNQGLLATFARFKVCKKPFLSPLCSFCDTLRKMNSYKTIGFTVKQIKEFVSDTNNNLVITGGEPGVYIDSIDILLDYYKEIGAGLYALNVETNGYELPYMYETIYKYKDIIKYPKIIYSPKILSEKELNLYIQYHTSFKNNQDMLDNLYIKLLVSKDNLEFTNKIIEKTILPYFKREHIWLMPLGRNVFDIISNSEVASDLSIKYKCNVSSRLHILFNFE